MRDLVRNLVAGQVFLSFLREVRLTRDAHSHCEVVLDVVPQHGRMLRLLLEWVDLEVVSCSDSVSQDVRHPEQHSPRLRSEGTRSFKLSRTDMVYRFFVFVSLHVIAEQSQSEGQRVVESGIDHEEDCLVFV